MNCRTCKLCQPWSNGEDGECHYVPPISVRQKDWNPDRLYSVKLDTDTCSAWKINDWQFIERAGRTSYFRETPMGRVVVKKATLSSRATVWQAVFPDGSTKNEMTAEDAKTYADDWIERIGRWPAST